MSSPALVAALSAAIAASVAGCAKEIHDPIAAEVDFRDPKSVTASIFYAAGHGRSEHLAGLCDPTGAADVNTRRICATHPGAPDWDSFRRAFARARLNGEPRVSGDHARIDFLFGPEGDDSETMELVRRDGRWYLSSF
ncbi:MAG TPA: hypothetical protein VK698_34890 [Kofleriaceae bacterium]|nr:hypothetical protein [Kofleriaceae bacterium]